MYRFGVLDIKVNRNINREQVSLGPTSERGGKRGRDGT